MCWPKLDRVHCLASIRALVIRHRKTESRSNVSGSDRITHLQETVWYSCRPTSDARENSMARPIPLEIPPRNPRAELQSRLEQAPLEHAEAVLAAYEVLQELHNHGVLEIMRGALAASDEILEKVVDDAKSPEAIRAIRNLLFWRRILGSIEPEWFKGIFKAIPEGI